MFASLHQKMFHNRNYISQVFLKLSNTVIGSIFTIKTVLKECLPNSQAPVENALRRCVKIKRASIRNDKKSLTKQKTWIEAEPKRQFAKINQNMQPNDASHKMIQRNLLHKVKTEVSIKNISFNDLKRVAENGTSLTKQGPVKKQKEKSRH